jgi:sugar lactone lactonase YvrE
MKIEIFHTKVFIYSLVFLLIILISNEFLPGRTISDINEENTPVVRIKKAGKSIPVAQQEQFKKLMAEGKDLLQNEMDYHAAIQKFNEALRYAPSTEQKSDVYFYISLAQYALSSGEERKELTDAMEMLIRLDYHRSLDQSLCPPRYIEIYNNLKNKYGALKILSQPPGADVYLNSSKISAGKTPLTIGHKAGRIKIVVKKGSKKKEETVEVIAGEETASSVFVLAGKSILPYVLGVVGAVGVGILVYKLVSGKEENGPNGPNGIKTGNINVKSKPSGATIYLDGEDKGQTPSTISNISVGTHSLKLVLEFYGEWEGDVVVQEGQTTEIEETLNPYKYEIDTQWGSKGNGNGQFDIPHGVALDASGNVYVTDVNNGRVQKFNSNGNFITAWTGFVFPRGVAIDGTGNVYVTEQHRIRKFASDGTQINSWGSLGSGDGQFKNPMGIAVDSSGNIYVADYSNNRVQKFDLNYNFIDKIGGLERPKDVTVDNSGDIWIVDTDNHRVRKYTSAFQHILSFGKRGSEDDEFAFPSGIATDHLGYAYVADTQNRTVKKFRSDAAFVTKWGDQQFDSYIMLAVDSSGNVYVSEVTYHRIIKFRITTNTLSHQSEYGSYKYLNKRFGFKKSIGQIPTRLRIQTKYRIKSEKRRKNDDGLILF